MSMEHIDIGPDFVAIAGIFSDHAFLEYLHNQSTIDYVEPNQVYSTTHMQPSVIKHQMNQKRELKTSQAANWGLARINQRQLGDLNEYQFDDISGEGVTVFVLDTGVYAEHIDLEGRASHSANVVKYEDATDMGGHGTHVSGKIIGKEYGVAKGAQVKSVKILNKSGDGSTSSLLRGVQHVIQNAVPGKTLVNLSLSGAKSKLLDEALDNLVLKYNIPVFVSAGNAGTDSCFFSPSSNPNVFSVGAIDRSDNVPKFSNVGECVDIYAPGRDIVSTYIGSVDSSKSMDGTSMASPHVAGIAANLMSKKQFNTAQEVYDALRALATSGVVHFDAVKSSSPNNNLLAFNEI
ncbi:peptidase S8/S53 domain-containing protein [Gilbertella persicaria]|uniref:peptidase S8/S53 domain-containing protein n=1 Tax=Gilbertella persicaria TaxID=101096 RepID=UPI00221FE9C6|nr:peptidase S8/S53 domain-containing protein [Gilbertella persicaria]KAI8055590.1 peptidase S8/S53 domain-containing protein [Gilbertella persicaria]